ncbi:MULTISPECIES: PAS domain-containing protein [Halorussus]|uniref:PAS domain-containing protein n=1 Tax=Halorussus TaxID=1070314 RepID=UPI00209EC6C5|nr:PAS domain-containing protein [Halorussus vallis]USZ77920.1 PAS domain-containing protein [Halorussus vallis]
MDAGRISPDDVLAACGGTPTAHEPVTASEVAAELDCSRRTAYNKLAELADRDEVRSKKVGARSRVWWLPADRASPEDRTPVADALADEVALDGAFADEAAREQFETELAEVFGRISDAFYALDDEWRFTHVNERAEELIDYRGEGLVGENLWETFEWATDSKLGEEYREAMETGEPTAFEFYYPEPLDAWYEVHAYPSESGLSVYFQDVTERRDRERELVESERRYRTLVEHFPNGAVALVDEDLRYRTVGGNPLGSTTDEPEGRRLTDALPSELADELAPRYEAAFEGESSTFEIEYEGSSYRIWVLPVRDEDGDIFAAFGMSQDVTEQKERERYLDDAKSQLEAATEAGAVGTWEWNIPDDRFVTGASFAKTFGVDPEAAREGVELDRIVSAIHEADRERVEREIEAAIETCGEYEEEYRVWNADGELRWVVARGHVESDEAGDPVNFPGALADITERKRAEQELQEHRRQLETLFEVLPVGVVVTDADGTVIEANEAAKDVWDVDTFDATGVADYERYRGWWADTGEAVAPDEWTLARVLRGEEVTDPDVFEIETADGERRVIMVHGMPIYGESGEVTRGVATLTDITERREYQRQLEASERRYRTLAEHFPNGAVGVYDPDLRFTLTRGAVLGEKLPGRDRLEDSRLREVFPEGPVDDIEPLFRAAVEDGETASIDTAFAGRHWRVWATPLRDADGDVFAGLSFTQDVTRHVERERKLERTVEKLEESNERLESFASMLAHELRNPVAIGQIYGRQLPAEVAPDAVEYVTESFDRIEDMIDVMLVLTRGRDVVSERAPVVLADAAREAWADVEAPDATVSIAVDRTIRADGTYVRHLFRNLLENAVEHGGPGVDVTVGDLPDGFYVADDGPGIPADERETVFEAGYTTAAGNGGTGLGLAFIEKLAGVYGWDCRVTESESGGARFEFTNVDCDVTGERSGRADE